MALCPFATRRLIPPGSSDPRISPRVAILHVDAGNADSLHDFFANRSGGIESHFHIKRDGEIEQYRDTSWQADANHHANDFAVSIETQGYGAGEWTPEQLGSIKRLLVWLNQAHPAIRLAKCDRWDGSGVGYHIQFGSPGPWTPVAKACPGPDRIRQFNNEIVPWLNAGAEEGDDMPLSPEDKQWIRVTVREQVEAVVPDIAKAVLNADVIARLDVSVREALRDVVDKSAHRAAKEK